MSIEIYDQKIDKVKTGYKISGFSNFIDDEPSWKYHIDQIITKISKMTGIMAKARHYLSIQTLNTIYNTIVSVSNILYHYMDKHVPNQAKIVIHHTKKKY